MIKYEVKNRYSSETQFIAEIDCVETAQPSVKLGLAVIWAVMNGADLYGADLTWANLAGADLSEANLNGVNLTGANLYGADLTGANLYGADLAGANLTGADLTGADLAGANLARADLTGAKLTRADLAGANLYRAKGQRGELLVGSNPIITIGPMGSRRDSLIIQNYADDVWVKAGCFFGSIADFKEKVIATHGNNNHAKNYLAACDFIQAWRLTQIG